MRVVLLICHCGCQVDESASWVQLSVNLGGEMNLVLMLKKGLCHYISGQKSRIRQGREDFD